MAKAGFVVTFFVCVFCSVVHPKAGDGATAGVWTNTGSLYLVMRAVSRVLRSATTWRANERTEGRLTDGERKKHGDGRMGKRRKR